MFCMLLRKHLVGARITGISQPDFERMLVLDLDGRDELGTPVKKQLIVEMLGRQSNVILVSADGHIIDCMRRVDSSMSETRQVQPGLFYRLPLRQDKPVLFDTTPEQRAQLLSGKSLSDGDGERSYYVGACAESGFSLILQQPQTYTAQVVRSIYLVAALMGALCLVLCLVCAWWLSRRLFEPVNELDGAMRRVEGGDYDVRIESTRQDEMGRLAASFDLERSVQRERELNETRLRMLQSQLNPHFLYNTLDCMKWLGVTGGAPQVAELAAYLAALLRAGDKLKRSEAEKVAGNLPSASVFGIILTAAALIAEGITAIAAPEKLNAADISFAAGAVILCAAFALSFSRRQAVATKLI